MAHDELSNWTARSAKSDIASGSRPCFCRCSTTPCQGMRRGWHHLNGLEFKSANIKYNQIYVGYQAIHMFWFCYIIHWTITFFFVASLCHRRLPPLRPNAVTQAEAAVRHPFQIVEGHMPGTSRIMRSSSMAYHGDFHCDFLWIRIYDDIWQCVKTQGTPFLYPCSSHQNSWDSWMFIPLKMVCI